MIRELIAPCFVILLAVSASATSHSTATSPPGVQSPRVGLMSKEVVWRQLELAGYTQLSQLTRQGTTYLASAVKDGRPVSLEIDATSGVIRERRPSR